MQKNHSQNICRSEGFSTIELLIAFSVGMIFLTAALLVSYSDPTLARQISLDSGQTTALDAVLDTNALSTSTNRIGGIVSALGSNWNTLFTSNSDTSYTTTPTVTDISPCFKEITDVTTWNTFGRTGRTMTFGTGIGNLNIAKALGRGGCDPAPPSSWDNPENPTWQTHPNDIDGTQTGLDVATVGAVPYVFITTTHNSQKADLWVINVSNTSNPTVVNSLETGGDNAHKNGLNDVVVVTTTAGTYGYVLQNSADNQLQTINLSNPVGTLSVGNTISFATYGVAPTGTNPQGKVVTYYNGRLYIGFYNTIGPEILVFDVKSNPATPLYVGKLDLGHSINDITVNGNYAYLAIKPGSPPTGLSTKELMIVDISGNNPVATSYGYNAANNTTNDTEAATTLYLLGNKLYMGREKVSAPDEKDFYVFDISNPTSLTVLKSKKMSTIGTNISMGSPRIIDLVVQGKIGFFVTTDSNKPFQVFDVVSNSTDIVPVSNCSYYVNLPKLTEIKYKDDLIYGANGNHAALNILRDNPNACTP